MATGIVLSRLRDAARDGSWLTVRAMRTFAGIAAGSYVCVFIALIVAGLNADGTAGPVAADFSQVWAAGVSTLRGHPLAPYDLATHALNLHRLFGPRAPPYAWVYPPFCLLPAALLAVLPYLAALVVEQALMLALYAWSIHSILPRKLAVLCALALPGVIINLVYGQLGTLTAGLGGLAAASLGQRPLLAGVCFACMSYKPQLGLAIPVALIAGRCWRTIAAGTATLAILVLGSMAAYGWQSWVVFATSLRSAGSIVLSDGAVDWYKLASAYAAARLLGLGPVWAWAAQGIVVSATLAAVTWVWWNEIDRRLSLALLFVAGLLCSPYCFEYDLVVLGPAITLFVSHGLDHGFLPWQKTLLAGFGLAPLTAGLAAHSLLLPAGLFALLGLASLIVVRAASSSYQPDASVAGT